MNDGLMTPTPKLKPRAITKAYAADIDALYALKKPHEPPTRWDGEPSNIQSR